MKKIWKIVNQGLEPLTHRLQGSDLTNDTFLPLSVLVDGEVFIDT